MFCSQFYTSLDLVPWTMLGGSTLLEQTCGFYLQVYSSIHKPLLLPCIKALVVAWLLFLRI